MAYIITAYYTLGTQYEDHAKKLEESLIKFKLPYKIIPIKNQGNWYKNTQYKPIFLQQMLKNYSPHSVVYVDVDAVFCRYPSFFDKLEKREDFSVSAHILDHSKYNRKNRAPELLSGTIFLKNNKKTRIIIDEWIEACKSDPKIWDQRALETVLRTKKGEFCVLPEEYCVIFDYMAAVKDPVIKHFQASRIERRKLQDSNSNQSKKVRQVNSGRFRGVRR